MKSAQSDEKARLGALGCDTAVLFLSPPALPTLCSPVGSCCWDQRIPAKRPFNPGSPTTLHQFPNWHLHGRWRKWPSRYTLGQCERTARLMALLAVCLQADPGLETAQRLSLPDQLVGFRCLPCYRHSVGQVKMGPVWLASLLNRHWCGQMGWHKMCWTGS